MTPLSRVLAGLGLAAFATGAEAYDMDCKLLLCLAGGFPAGCADAKAYMIARLTATPPKPPIGVCAFSGGHGAYATTLSRIPHSPEKYACAPDLSLHVYGREGRDGDAGAFCYRSREEICVSGPDGGCAVIHHGRQDVSRTFEWAVTVTLASGFSSGTVLVDVDPQGPGAPRRCDQEPRTD